MLHFLYVVALELCNSFAILAHTILSWKVLLTERDHHSER